MRVLGIWHSSGYLSFPLHQCHFTAWPSAPPHGRAEQLSSLLSAPLMAKRQLTEPERFEGVEPGGAPPNTS